MEVKKQASETQERKRIVQTLNGNKERNPANLKKLCSVEARKQDTKTRIASE